MARYLDRVTLLVLHYDNRADPTAEDEATGAYAWNTHFDSIGLRLQTDNGWTAIIQWLKGQTSVEPDGEYYAWPFYTQFALVSRHWGRNTVSARYDEFGVDSEAPLNLGDEDGHAWTVAYSFDQSANWRFTLEWLHVTSEVASRAAPRRAARRADLRCGNSDAVFDSLHDRLRQELLEPASRSSFPCGLLCMRAGTPNPSRSQVRSHSEKTPDRVNCAPLGS